MTSIVVRAGNLHGQVSIPGSKSQTIRAILFATLARGTSVIENYLHSPDTWAMVHACEKFGANIEVDKMQLTIKGVGGQLKHPDDIIDAGNSGQVLRFIGALAGLLDHFVIITGDHSIRYLRPALPLLSGLEQLGCTALSTKEDGKAPLMIKGPIQGGCISIDGQDSQPVSGLIIASAFAKHPVEIMVINPGETAWVNLTLSWLDRFSIPYERQGFSRYRLYGNAAIDAFLYTIPADFSSAAFPLIAALITKSKIKLNHLDFNDVQGDKQIIDLLCQLGAAIEFEDSHLVINGHSSQIKGAKIDVNPYIDALPILAVLACFAESDTHLYGAKIARNKESDRIAAICTELTKMGAKVQELEDGIYIQASELYGAHVFSHHDHRIAMALAVAAMAATGETRIDNGECVAKSFPNFVASFQHLGAKIHEE